MKVGERLIRNPADFFRYFREVYAEDWNKGGFIRRAYLVTPVPYIMLLTMLIITVIIIGVVFVSGAVVVLAAGIANIITSKLFLAFCVVAIVILLGILVWRH